MRARRLLAVAIASLNLAAGAADASPPRPEITLGPIGLHGETIVLQGRLTGLAGSSTSPRATLRIQLRSYTSTQTFTRRVTTTGFTVHVRNRLSGVITLVVQIREHDRPVGRPTRLEIGVVKPEVQPCDPLPPVPAPPGDGVIIGGIHVIGGPPPGLDNCSSGTVVVTDAEGAVVASQDVVAPDPFAFTLPPGTYTLQVAGAGEPCLSGPVTVTAGETSHADVDCDVP